MENNVELREGERARPRTRSTRARRGTMGPINIEGADKDLRGGSWTKSAIGLPKNNVSISRSRAMERAPGGVRSETPRVVDPFAFAFSMRREERLRIKGRVKRDIASRRELVSEPIQATAVESFAKVASSLRREK